MPGQPAHPGTIRIDIQEEVRKARPQLPVLRFPIASAEALLGQLRVKSYLFRNQHVPLERAVAGIPRALFPLISEDDFMDKVAAVISARAQRKSVTVVGVTPRIAEHMTRV